MSTTVKEESLWPQHCADGRNHVVLNKEESFTSVETEVVSSPQYGRENFTFSKKFEKVEKLQPRRYPEHPAVQGPQSDAESTPKMPEKGLDGYNWRKYGQKLVKGNKFIRSYYRCTSPNCEAKKQIERSSDGCKTEMNYLGKHHHPKPRHSHQVICTSQAQVTEKRIVTAPETDTEDGGMDHDVMLTEASHQSIVETSAEGVAGAVCCSHNHKDYPPDAKRKKTEITSPGDNLANRPNNVLRHVVQTLSDVDLVNDGYRWRKYGQKLVKGSPNPRCSTAGCPAKKHVERAFHDSKFVITTYEGEHDHSMPPRSISQRDTQVHANMTSKNVESRSKPEERNPVVQEITCGGIIS